MICVYYFELFSQVSDVAHGPLDSYRSKIIAFDDFNLIIILYNNYQSGS